MRDGTNVPYSRESVTMGSGKRRGRVKRAAKRKGGEALNPGETHDRWTSRGERFGGADYERGT